MIRLVISEPRSESAGRLVRHLARHNRVQVLGQAYDGVEAAQMALVLQPDALVVEEHLAGLSGAEVCSLVSRNAPQVCRLLLTERLDPAFLRLAMRSGAQAVLTLDQEVGAVVAVLQQLVDAAQQAAAPEFRRLADPAQMPLTFVAVGAREGQGTTTLLVALALQFARAQTGEVVLLDWRPQLSDLAATLGLRPTYSLVDLIPYSDQMDLEAVSTCLTRHESGLWVLPGMLRPEHAWLEPLTTDFAAHLLGLLRRRFRFICVDLPPAFCPPERYLARHAHVLLLVTSLGDAGALRATATFADLLRAQDFPEERLRLIVTRQGRRDPFRPEDLTNLTHLPISATIPEDPNLLKSIRNGDTSASGRGPAVVAVRTLAEALITEVQTHVSRSVEAL